MIRHKIYNELSDRLREKRRFMQVLTGPRQVGKTTLARQVMAALPMPTHYASADEPNPAGDHTWLAQQWEIARLKARNGQSNVLLVLDEIQKVAHWPHAVKVTVHGVKTIEIKVNNRMLPAIRVKNAPKSVAYGQEPSFIA